MLSARGGMSNTPLLAHAYPPTRQARIGADTRVVDSQACPAAPALGLSRSPSLFGLLQRANPWASLPLLLATPSASATPRPLCQTYQKAAKRRSGQLTLTSSSPKRPLESRKDCSMKASLPVPRGGVVSILKARGQVPRLRRRLAAKVSRSTLRYPPAHKAPR
jgi:hypothetical protein